VSEIVEEKSIVVPPAERPGLTAEQRAEALFPVEQCPSTLPGYAFYSVKDPKGRLLGSYGTEALARESFADVIEPIARAIAAAEQQAYTAGVHISRQDIAKQVRNFAHEIRAQGAYRGEARMADGIASVVESIADGLEGKHRPLITVAR
jgi:hypothetical protein